MERFRRLTETLFKKNVFRPDGWTEIRLFVLHRKMPLIDETAIKIRENRENPKSFSWTR